MELAAFEGGNRGTALAASTRRSRLTDQRQGTGTTQVAHFDYDFNGNLITRWSTPSVLVETLTYDPKNRLKALVRGTLQPTFRYDPFDYRTEKTIAAGSARHYYLEGEHLEMVTDVNNAVLGKYLRGVVIDEIVNGYQRALATDDYSIWSWQHDAVGSVTQLVRHEGTAELAQRYLPFGEKTISQPPTNFFGYTGREEESENGTYYYRTRYYDPALGRFLSEDPIGFNGGINFYAYVGDNPLVASDPLGLREFTPEEKALFAPYFAETTLNQVDIDTGFAPNFTGRAWSPSGHNVRVPRNFFIDGDPGKPLQRDDPGMTSVVGHEILHTWQREQGKWVTTDGFFLQAANTLTFRRYDPYDYDKSGTTAKDVLQIFQRGNVEQQGQIYQDYIYENEASIKTGSRASTVNRFGDVNMLVLGYPGQSGGNGLQSAYGK